jgi:hypothetical protein
LVFFFLVFLFVVWRFDRFVSCFFVCINLAGVVGKPDELVIDLHVVHFRLKPTVQTVADAMQIQHCRNSRRRYELKPNEQATRMTSTSKFETAKKFWKLLSIGVLTFLANLSSLFSSFA